MTDDPLDLFGELRSVLHEPLPPRSFGHWERLGALVHQAQHDPRFDEAFAPYIIEQITARWKQVNTPPSRELLRALYAGGWDAPRLGRVLRSASLRLYGDVLPGSVLRELAGAPWLRLVPMVEPINLDVTPEELREFVEDAPLRDCAREELEHYLEVYDHILHTYQERLDGALLYEIDWDDPDTVRGENGVDLPHDARWGTLWGQHDLESLLHARHTLPHERTLELHLLSPRTFWEPTPVRGLHMRPIHPPDQLKTSVGVVTSRGSVAGQRLRGEPAGYSTRFAASEGLRMVWVYEGIVCIAQLTGAAPGDEAPDAYWADEELYDGESGEECALLEGALAETVEALTGVSVVLL